MLLWSSREQVITTRHEKLSICLFQSLRTQKFSSDSMEVTQTNRCVQSHSYKFRLDLDKKKKKDRKRLRLFEKLPQILPLLLKMEDI